MVDAYIPYPDIDNKDFYKKIYSKKEFYETKAPPLPNPDNQSNKTMSSLFPTSGNFILNSQQVFLQNFISESTPYKGILVFHGTGTGKTCASISIAERFREMVQKKGQKILIIASGIIQNEFRKTIFDKDKQMKATFKQVVQCTGKTYSLQSSKQSYEKQEKQIQQMIHDIYEFYGRVKLVNKLSSEIHWDGKKELTDIQRDEIKRIYSNKVIIIDEVHRALSEKEGSFREAIQIIIGNAENIRLVLMSATPIVNYSSDILFSINLLRLNDRRPIIQYKDIFTKDEIFVKNGENLFRESVKGYVSYVRGGETPRFPYKMIPKEACLPISKYTINGSTINHKDRTQYTKLILCPMDMFQYKIYKSIIQNLIKNAESISATEAPAPIQAGNIVFPLQNKNEGTYGISGYSKIPNETTFIEKKDSSGNIIYNYSSFCKGFLLQKNVGKYSSKMKKVLDIILMSKGISFIYSKYIPASLRVMALMLEENGFTPANITGREYPLFYSSSTRKKPICYKCFKEKHDSRDHEWFPAKYMLLTGSQGLSTSDISKITGHVNREDNKYGKLVKVLLGSEVSAEGVDFKRIRQVHIMDGWFNKAKNDQIEGRAIRNGSHKDLLPSERNVDIYTYCITNPVSLKGKDKYIETYDEYLYRLSENKDKKFKKIEYILKQSAVDCLFQKYNNIRNIQRNIEQENSIGQKILFTTGDKPFSRECNYMKSCTYKCSWEPTGDVKINKSTYTEDFITIDIQKVQKVLQKLFIKNPVYHIDEIFTAVQKAHKNMESIYIYLGLESIMNKNSQYSIQDQYKREGYIIEKDQLYIFQPNELPDENSPLLYKKIPITKKPKEIPFIFEKTLEKEKEENKTNKKNIYQEVHNKYNIVKKIIGYYTSDKKYNNEILDTIFSSLSEKEIISFCKRIYHSKEKLDKEFVEYFKKKGNIYNTIIVTENFSTELHKSQKNIVKWGAPKPENESIGRNILYKTQHKELWKKVSLQNLLLEDDTISKRKYMKIIKDQSLQPLYIGHIDIKDKSGKRFLKLFDFTTVTNKNITSKRDELRGKVCSSFSSIKILVNIRNYLQNEIKKLSLPNFTIVESTKNSKRNICIQIEFLLRILHTYSKKIWVIDYSFESKK